MIRRAILLLLLLAGTAVAQDATRAQEQFAKGKSHYDLAEWDEAIAAWKEAYRLDPDPLFLYNLGQVYRQKGDCRQARTFYRTYLREDPAAYNRDKVEKRIEEMAECIRKAGGDPDAPDPVVEPEPEPTPDPVEPTPDPVVTQPEPTPVEPAPVAAPVTRDRTRWFAGMAVATAGAVAVGTGVYFSLRASDAADELEILCDVECDADSAVIRELDERGRTSQRNASILYVAGGLGIAAGVALMTWAVTDSESPQRVAVTPTRDGAIVTLSNRF